MQPAYCRIVTENTKEQKVKNENNAQFSYP